MQQATIDGVTLEYLARGDGPPVVFIHGAAIADAFETLVDQPALRGYTLVTYRRRGYGASGPSEPASLAEQAADCAGLLRTLDIESAHVVGHSFGGSVALQLALDAPDLAHSLVLLEPALTLGSSGPAYRESLEQAVRRSHEVGAEPVVDGFLEARWPGYRAPLDERVPGAFDRAVVDARGTFAIDIPALLDWDLDVADLARVTQPVLSVVGGGSEHLDPRFGEMHGLLLASLSRAEGFVLPGAHHFLQVENPLDMATQLAAFLARHPFDR